MGFVAVRDLLPQTIDRLDLLHQSPGDIRGVPTGFTQLDRKTTGLQPGDLIVIAGRPSMGKTTLAMNIAENAAIAKGVPAAIFSMEMSSEQLVHRAGLIPWAREPDSPSHGQFLGRGLVADPGRHVPAYRARRYTSMRRRR